jgi:hypothetical protein
VVLSYTTCEFGFGAWRTHASTSDVRNAQVPPFVLTSLLLACSLPLHPDVSCGLAHGTRTLNQFLFGGPFRVLRQALDELCVMTTYNVYDNFLFFDAHVPFRAILGQVIDFGFSFCTTPGTNLSTSIRKRYQFQGLRALIAWPGVTIPPVLAVKDPVLLTDSHLPWTHEFHIFSFRTGILV